MNARARLHCAALALLLVGLTSGCSSETESESPAARLAGDRPLGPPVLLARGPGCGLLAVLADGGDRELTLWRADSLGRNWRRWTGLGRPAASGRVGLAVSAEFAVVACAAGSAIEIVRVPLAPARDASAQLPAVSLEAHAPVLFLALDGPRAGGAARASGPAGRAGTGDARAPGTPAPLHLVYTTQAEGDTIRTLCYQRSPDWGATWSEPESLASGALGAPAIFARSGEPGQVDVCYPRGESMAWRGSVSAGTQWIAEQPIRLRTAPGMRSAIARAGAQVLVLCENELHQVAGAVSPNGGHTWERAIAIARESRHLRLPSLDMRGHTFWACYSQGDSAVIARATSAPGDPQQWRTSPVAARTCCLDAPSIAALDDGSAAILFALPEGDMRFVSLKAGVAVEESRLN